MTYGIVVDSDDDGLVSSFSEILDRIAGEGPPGASIIDLFPIRKRFRRALWILPHQVVSQVHTVMDAWCLVPKAYSKDERDRDQSERHAI